MHDGLKIARNAIARKACILNFQPLLAIRCFSAGLSKKLKKSSSAIFATRAKRAVNPWEAGIKASLGRLTLPDTVESGVEDSGFEKLQISFSHAEAAAALPANHGDLFDRMLVAQAVSESLSLVTHDRRLETYVVPIVWTW